MAEDDTISAPLKRFRLTTVGLSLLVTLVFAGVAWFIDPVAAQGVLLGGFAGILGFWIIAIRLEKVVHLNPEKVQFAALTYSTMRFAMYGLVLYKTFTLDRENMHGLIGGLVGIMTIRFVLVFVGVTGLDKRVRKSTSGVNEAVGDEDVAVEGSDGSESSAADESDGVEH
jgi:hypothetical protein